VRPVQAFLLASLAAPVGCRDVLDVKGYGTAPPTFIGKCDGIPYSSESCQKCMDESCCNDAMDCAGDPSCTALATCLARCSKTDVRCRTTCHLSIRRTTAASKVIACAATQCKACAAARAAPGGQDCAACLEAQAPEDVATFSKNVDALEFESCRKDCPPTYEEQCPCSAFEAGKQALQVLQDVPLCTMPCERPDWSCLGNVQWPPLPSQTSSRPSLELHVGAAPVSNATIHMVGATVTLCGEVDPDCTGGEVMKSTIQDDGFATFTIPPTGVNPYFGRLALDYTAQGDPTNAIFYFVPDLRRSPTWTWRRTVSQATAKSNIDLLGMGIELEWDKKGGIIWSASACNAVPAEGIKAKMLASGEQMFYLDKDQTLKPLEETSKQALGAVINAEPGLKSMELRRSDGEFIGRYEFRVVAGAITTLSLSPGPSDTD
jgi:hypothetical protein